MNPDSDPDPDFDYRGYDPIEPRGTNWRARIKKLLAPVIAVALFAGKWLFLVAKFSTIFIAVAVVAAPPRMVLVVVTGVNRRGIVCRSRAVSVAAAVAGVIRFRAALKREHPENERSRSDGSDNLAVH